jgi:Tfp pilus assembly major pilin PilA
MGKPLVAFPDQNHEAHLRIHIEFLTHPMFGQSQLLAPAVIPQMLTHLKDHIVYWYVASLVEMGEAVTGVDMAKLMDEDEEVEREYENLLADLSSRVLAGSEAALGPFQIPQVVQQAIQIMQQLQQMAQGGPQSDPAAVAMADIERQGAADQAKAQSDQARMQIDAMRTEIEQSKLALKEKELALKEAELSARYGIEGQKVQQQTALKSDEMNRQDMRVAGQIAAQVKMNESDNAIALQIARERLMAGRAPGVTNGTGINPAPR